MSNDHMDAWLERDRRHKDAEARSERLIELLRKERDALRAKLDAIHRYVADRADISDINGMPNVEGHIWQEFFGGKEPIKSDQN